MFRKFALSAVMIVSLAFGASQLMAVSDGDTNSFGDCSTPQWNACPATNAGGTLVDCYGSPSIWACAYSNGTHVRMP